MAEGIIATRLEINDNLPAAVTNFNLVLQSSGPSGVMLTWTLPPTNCSGVAIIRKENSAPVSFTDGVVIYDGTGTSFVDTDVVENTIYYYRIYTYNSRRQIQTFPVSKSILYQMSMPPGSLPRLGKVYVQESKCTEIYFKIDGNDFIRTHGMGGIQGSTSVNSTDEANERFLKMVNNYSIYSKYPKGLNPIGCLRSSPTHQSYEYDKLSKEERITTMYPSGYVYGGDKKEGGTSYYFLNNVDVDSSTHNKIFYENSTGVMKSTDYAIGNREFRPMISLANYRLYAQPDRDGVYSIIL